MLLLLSVWMLAAFASQYRSNNSGARGKARYYYLQGAKEEAAGNQAEAYEYYKKAEATDPSYKEGVWGAELNRLELMLSDYSNPDTIGIENSYGSLKILSDYFSDDYYESRKYAAISQYLGNIDEAVRVYGRMDSLFPQKTGTLLSLADCYDALDSLGGVIDVLNRYERIEGPSIQLSAKKVGYQMAFGDTVSAIEEGKRLISSNPRNALFHCLMGNIYQMVGQMDSAKMSYEEAEQLDPESGPVKISFASFYSAIGDSVGFDTKVYEALLAEDYELEDKLELLTQYLQELFSGNGSKDRGDKLFEVLNRQYPHEPQLLELSAAYHAAKSDWAGAADAISYAIDQQPDNEGYWLLMMNYKSEGKDFAGVEKTFENAVKVLGETESLDMAYVQAANTEQEYDKSMRVLNRLLKRLVPEMTTAYDSIAGDSLRDSLSEEDQVKAGLYLNIIGDIHLERHEQDLCFKAYDNSLYFFPDNAGVLNNYAYDLSMVPDSTGVSLSRAERMSLKALQLSPDNPTYLDTYAWINFQMGNYVMARVYQSQAINKLSEGEGTADLYDHYGDILIKCEQPDEAIEYWEKALELSPGNELIERKIRERAYFDK